MEISSLSEWDYINIVGQYHRANGKATIDPALKDRGYTEAQLKALESKLKNEKRGRVIKTLNLEISEDLSAFDYPMFNFIITTHRALEKGLLPFQGSYAEQPAQIIEIFNLIDQLNFEAQEKQAREFKAEQERLKAKNGRR